MRRRRLAHEGIFGDVNVHWARSTAARKVEGLRNRVRNLIGGAHQVVVLRHRQRNAGDVDLLEGVLTDQRIRNIARDEDNGDGVEHGGTDAGDEVGGTRARGAEADAHLARGAGVAVSGVRCGLFMTDQDVTKLGVVNEHVVEREDDAARVTPDGVAPLQEDCLTKSVGTNAWACAATRGDARIAQHVASRALRRTRGGSSCPWYVPCLCHRSPFTTS